MLHSVVGFSRVVIISYKASSQHHRSIYVFSIYISKLFFTNRTIVTNESNWWEEYITQKKLWVVVKLSFEMVRGITEGLPIRKSVNWQKYLLKGCICIYCYEAKFCLCKSNVICVSQCVTFCLLPYIQDVCPPSICLSPAQIFVKEWTELSHCKDAVDIFFGVVY